MLSITHASNGVNLATSTWDQLLNHASQGTLPVSRVLEELLCARLPQDLSQPLALRELNTEFPRICDILFGHSKPGSRNAFEDKFGTMIPQNCSRDLLRRILDPNSPFFRHVVALSMPFGSDEVKHALNFDCLPAPLAVSFQNMVGFVRAGKAVDTIALAFLKLCDRETAGDPDTHHPANHAYDGSSERVQSPNFFRVNTLQYFMVRFLSLVYKPLSKDKASCFRSLLDAYLEHFFPTQVSNSIFQQKRTAQVVSSEPIAVLSSSLADVIHVVLLSRPFLPDAVSGSREAPALCNGGRDFLPVLLLLAVQSVVEHSTALTCFLAESGAVIDALFVDSPVHTTAGFSTPDEGLKLAASEYVSTLSLRLFPWLLVALESATPMDRFDGVVNIWCGYITPWTHKEKRMTRAFTPFVRANFFYYATLLQVYFEQVQNYSADLVPTFNLLRATESRIDLANQMLQVLDCFVNESSEGLVYLLKTLEASFVRYQHRQFDKDSAVSHSALQMEQERTCKFLETQWRLLTISWAIQGDFQPTYLPLLTPLSLSSLTPVQLTLNAVDQILCDLLSRFIALKTMVEPEEFSFLQGETPFDDSRELSSKEGAGEFYPETPLARKQAKSVNTRRQPPRALDSLSDLELDPLKSPSLVAFERQVDSLVDFASPLPPVPHSVDRTPSKWLGFFFLALVSVVCYIFKGVLLCAKFAAPYFYATFCLFRTTSVCFAKSAASSFKKSLQDALEADVDLSFAVQKNADIKSAVLALLKETSASYQVMRSVLRKLLLLLPSKPGMLPASRRYVSEQLELDSESLRVGLLKNFEVFQAVASPERLLKVKRKLLLEIGFGLESNIQSSPWFKLKQSLYNLGTSLGIFPKIAVSPAALIQSGNKSGLYNRFAFQNARGLRSKGLPDMLVNSSILETNQTMSFFKHSVSSPQTRLSSKFRHSNATASDGQGPPEDTLVSFCISFVVNALESIQRKVALKLNSALFDGKAPSFLMNPNYSSLYSLSKLQFWVDLSWALLVIYFLYLLLRSML